MTPEEGAPPLTTLTLVGQRTEADGSWTLLARDAHGRVWEYRGCVAVHYTEEEEKETK